MRISEWLAGAASDGTPRVSILAELIYKNGGSARVTGWGCTSGGGIFGRMGLEMDEALELMKGWATAVGICLGSGESISVAVDIIQAEIKRMETEFAEN